jgi:hypothetical protein
MLKAMSASRCVVVQVVVVPGRLFSVHRHKSDYKCPYVRLAFCNTSHADLVEGARRFGRVLRAAAEQHGRKGKLGALRAPSSLWPQMATDLLTACAFWASPLHLNLGTPSLDKPSAYMHRVRRPSHSQQMCGAGDTVFQSHPVLADPNVGVVSRASLDSAQGIAGSGDVLVRMGSPPLGI